MLYIFKPQRRALVQLRIKYHFQTYNALVNTTGKGSRYTGRQGNTFLLMSLFNGLCDMLRKTVDILSKQKPEGFGMWILANAGYVLVWMYHAKWEGAIDLDGWEFSQTDTSSAFGGYEMER